MLDAIANDRPVVALESTIISHGMPYPRNKQVVLDTEKLIRSMGVIPAACAIINGTSSLTDVTDCGHLFLARTKPIRLSNGIKLNLFVTM